MSTGHRGEHPPRPRDGQGSRRDRASHAPLGATRSSSPTARAVPVERAELAPARSRVVPATSPARLVGVLANRPPATPTAATARTRTSAPKAAHVQTRRRRGVPSGPAVSAARVAAPAPTRGRLSGPSFSLARAAGAVRSPASRVASAGPTASLAVPAAAAPPPLTSARIRRSRSASLYAGSGRAAPVWALRLLARRPAPARLAVMTARAAAVRAGRGVDRDRLALGRLGRLGRGRLDLGLLRVTRHGWPGPRWRCSMPAGLGRDGPRAWWPKHPGPRTARACSACRNTSGPGSVAGAR